MQPLRIMETVLYANDLSSIEAFYSGALGLPLVSADEDRHRFFQCGDAMLLVFDPEVTSEEVVEVEDQMIPQHGARGPGHIAFAVLESELADWREKLKQHDVAIEQEIEWPKRGYSIYFRDPAGNSVELVTPALWRFATP